MRDVKIPNWLKGLPLAPEFHPTDTEFADPIAYISKIEKQASAFGICKVIPPLPKPSKKYVLSNLNKSLSKCPELGSEVNLADGEGRAVFTTRHQELGQNAKRTKGGSVHPQISAAVHKQVWQSGEIYTVEQFESKSKNFARSQLGMINEVSPLVIEALFWKASCEKPISVEYANDVPGSGFGEPEGSFRYFRRGRRRKTFNKGATIHCSSNPNGSVMRSSLDQTSRQKSSNTVDEMEGSAGWKLSNSPWNLQAIARSAGSLTRFMPDDIPGVTSPMVYIGMLFSWFAWHVEDHELHSLNFLHTGSSKTWYAVPEDYAFDFEEVIRKHAYGGNIDRLAALTLLGEKTTLLSPEVIVTSGIPCCRLVQNPGEFVVTFPRAYHVGFSHGFSCGEAANFGTPKWLKVAKEAAVRRAAMNYLPMLSHQQLLYLLTMSFISRVPRSLLPGARSSRLRDRQKEERELLVKKAFIEDIINENNLLTNLLSKNSSYHVVLWDLESLPSSSKEPELCSSVASLATTKEDASSEKNSNEDLYSQMSICMENVNDLYVDDDDDDLSSDFQVDSGTLACVACGILGFPFMSVVQPSEKSSMNLREQGVSNPVEPKMLVDSVSDEVKNKQEKTLESKMPSASEVIIATTRLPRKSGNELELTNENEKSSIASNSFSLGATDKIMIPNESNLPNLSDRVSSTSVESSQSLPPEDLPVVALEVKFDKRWNTSSELLRPRIFCLEHAIQIEELLGPKGGANMLLICHSDFQKIRAPASAVAEEIGSPFKYDEIPLDTASQEDLNLINLAIDDEHNQCGEDWTSKLGINLRHCVKVRKDSSSVQVKHALKVGGLFLDTTTSPGHSSSNLNWQSRKFRSKLNLKHRVPLKPSAESIQTKKDEVKTDDSMVRQEDKIIQYYTRRTFKSKPGGVSAGARTTKDLIENSDPHRVETVNTDIENHTMQEMVLNGKACDSTIQSNPELQNEIGIAEEDDEKKEGCCGEESACAPVAILSTESVEICGERESMEEVSIMDEARDAMTVDNCRGGSSSGVDGHDDLMKDVSYSACSSTDHSVVSSSAERMERTLTEKSSTGSEVLDSETLGDRMNEKELVSTTVTSSEQSIPVLVEESFEVSQETTHAAERMQSGSKRKRELELQTEDQFDVISAFIRSPCEGLRSRAGKKNATSKSGSDPEKMVEEKEPPAKNKKKPSDNPVVSRTVDKRDNSTKKRNVNYPHRCDLEGCRMSFQTKAELSLHKRNKCPHEGCGKKFSTHKYAILHQRVHGDDRPLKCPWKGCTMSFKWAWARTEHLRVHTGERPYQCKVEGCGLTFRFVSDFSRHRRKTGHYVNPPT